VTDYSFGDMALKLNRISNPIEILFSHVSKMFYVTQSQIEIKEGGFLISPTCHRSTPNEALAAYFERLRAGRIIYGAYTTGRKEFRFNERERVFEEVIEYEKEKGSRRADIQKS